ncbi:MAG TPA: hypothetical protein VJR24_11130 [Gemmatimonadaceae bacterium]|nr:hypothetical protein [Gemmatimonadaceae bacterium]
MRGRILQYNGTDGTGTIAADNQQYKFDIGMWKSPTAPTVGKTVEIVVQDSQLSAVTIVPDDVLLREKTAELGGKLSGLVSNLGKSAGTPPGASPSSSAHAGGGAAVIPSAAPGLNLAANPIVQRYGTLTLGAYAVYLLGTLVFNAISITFLGSSQGKPLYDVANLLSQIGGGGGVKFMLIVAYLSIAVPLVWKDRRAWLALCVPLLAVLGALWSGIHAINSAAGGFGGGAGGGPGVSDLFSIGFGFYLSLAAGLVLAWAGFQRFTRNA